VSIHVPAPVRRIVGLGLALTLFVLLAGATYQGVATALERRRFQHPGRLVDVGGHQLHLYCAGEGVPTVVFEAAGGAMSASWGAVQPRIAATSRACSYDRAGLGWSEAGERRFDASRVAADLLRLLDAAGERPPFVVVGRGLGASFARVFAADYRDRTAALVLIDPLDESTGLRDTGMGRITAATPWAARAGIRRVLRQANRAAAGLPDASAGAARTFLYRPDHLSRAAIELAAWRDAVRLANTKSPAAPVTVVADAPDRIVSAIEAAVAAVRR
jgi:pimeloyl-ACP methyl ester carboxylesterase